MDWRKVMSPADMSLEMRDCPEPAPVALVSHSWAGTALAYASRVLAWPSQIIAARAAMQTLGSMSDHELRDIGLTRQDLRDATGMTSGDDPTGMLAGRASERRRFMR